MSLLNPKSQYPARIMIFIDGGYLRRWIVDTLKMAVCDFHFGSFSLFIVKKALQGIDNSIIIRTYYYDGLADPADKEYLTQKSLLNKINSDFPNYDTRVGRLIRDGEGKFRQKGVDVLMAIDMIEKAYSNQYDVAIIVAGDLDHLEAIQSVKNKGKQVFGVYHEGHIANELFDSFDNHLKFDDKNNKEFLEFDKKYGSKTLS